MKKENESGQEVVEKWKQVVEEREEQEEEEEEEEYQKDVENQ